MSIYFVLLLLWAFDLGEGFNINNAFKKKCPGEVSHYPVDAQYDAYFNKCIIPPKGRCHPFSDAEVECPQYSKCQYEWENSRCKCRDHFSISEDGHSCVLGELLGGPCNPNKGADANGCDTVPGLQCVLDKTPGKEDKGKCGCGDLMFWNNITENCMVKNCEQRMKNSFQDRKSGNCLMKLLEEFNPTEMTNKLVFCPPGAVSELNFPSRTMHYCGCDKGYKTNLDQHSCLLLKTFGETCQSLVADEICDDKQLLNCIDGTCQCNQDQPGGWNSNASTCINDAYCGRIAENLFYDPDSQECLGTIGKVVRVSVYDQPNRILLCPENSKSYLYPDRSRSSEDLAMCVCDRQFKSSPDARSCVPLQ